MTDKRICPECRGVGTHNNGVDYQGCWRCLGLGVIPDKEYSDENEF